MPIQNSVMFRLRSVVYELKKYDPQAEAPFADQLVVAIYASLTYSGKEFANLYFKMHPTMDPKMTNLVEEMLIHDESRRKASKDIVLGIQPMPRQTSSVLSCIAEQGLMETFILPRFQVRSNWHPIVILTTIVVNYYMFSLKRIPNAPFDSLVYALEKTLPTLPEQARLEFWNMATHFIDCCLLRRDLMYIKDTSSFGASGGMFERHIVRKFADDQRILALCNGSMSAADQNKPDNLFEMLLIEFMRLMGFYEKVTDADMKYKYEFSVVLLLRLCVNVTSQPGLGKWLAALLLFTRISGVIIWVKEHMASFDLVKKIKGYVYKLELNVRSILPGTIRDNPADVPECQALWGTSSAFFDRDYLANVVSSNMFLPSLSPRYISMYHYLIDNIILYKAGIAFALWEDLNICMQSEFSDTQNADASNSGVLKKCHVWIPEEEEEGSGNGDEYQQQMEEEEYRVQGYDKDDGYREEEERFDAEGAVNELGIDANWKEQNEEEEEDRDWYHNDEGDDYDKGGYGSQYNESDEKGYYEYYQGDEVVEEDEEDTIRIVVDDGGVDMEHDHNNLVVLLVINDQHEVTTLTFATILSKLGSQFKLRIEGNDPEGTMYNYVYQIKPATTSSYQTMKNAISMLSAGGELSKLERIWLGRDCGTKVLAERLPFRCIHLGGAIGNEHELQGAIRVLNKAGIRVEYDMRGSDHCIVSGVDASTVIFHDDEWLDICKTPFKFTKHQQAAILSVCVSPITLIVGPPGTGKTETMSAVVRVLFRTQFIEVRGRQGGECTPKMLICAHSNASLDQMLCEISKDIKVFRFGGQPSEAGEILTTEGKILSAISDINDALDVIEVSIEGLDRVNELIDVVRELNSCDFRTVRYKLQERRGQIVEMVRWRDDVMYAVRDNDTDAVNCIFSGLEHLSKPYGVIMREYLNAADVFGCTLGCLAGRISDMIEFNVKTVLLEEAAKVLETEMLSLLPLKLDRLILIGDQAQLSPIITSDDVRDQGYFCQSMFERLQRVRVPCMMLNRQGRAKRQIADLFRHRYPKPIKDLPSVAALPNMRMLDPGRVVQWVDVQDALSQIRENETEQRFIIEVLRRARKRNVWDDLDKVSVITPYNAQKRALKAAVNGSGLYPRDICTIDEFQGLQNDIIIISLVSNRPSIWFRDLKRITVLMSRARCGLIIFGRKSGFKDVTEWSEILGVIDEINRSSKLYLDGREWESMDELRQSNEEIGH